MRALPEHSIYMYGATIFSNYRLWHLVIREFRSANACFLKLDAYHFLDWMLSCFIVPLEFARTRQVFAFRFSDFRPGFRGGTTRRSATTSRVRLYASASSWKPASETFVPSRESIRTRVFIGSRNIALPPVNRIKLSILSFTDRERERERGCSCCLARARRGRERGLISMVIAGIGRRMQLSGEGK